MRIVVWMILLAVAATVAAALLGSNQGVVSIFYGDTRVDASLNLFIGVVTAAVVALHFILRAVNGLLGMPARAREWRELRRERAAQSALREAWAEYFAARFGRAHKAAQRALQLQPGVAVLRGDPEYAGLAHLVAALALHRIQDRRGRDERASQAAALASQAAHGSALVDGVHLLMAEWALDDRDAVRGLEALAALPPGVARRTQALRLKLQAQRLDNRPLEALQTARLLANHQGFSKVGAQSLLRSLAMDVIAHVYDEEQLRRAWNALDPADRRDPLVAIRAARRACELGQAELGRSYLQPHWSDIARRDADQRQALAFALIDCVAGIGSEWLPRVESALSVHAGDTALAAATGIVFAERQLWGKARRLLEQTARGTSLPSHIRRQALRRLAVIARLEGDEARGAGHEREAAAID